MPSLTQGKVTQRSNRVFLLLHHGLDQILDADHPNDFPGVGIDDGQVPDAVVHHLLHAHLDALVGGGRDDVGGADRGDLPDGRLPGGPPQQRNLANVVALADDARHVACVCCVLL